MDIKRLLVTIFAIVATSVYLVYNLSGTGDVVELDGVEVSQYQGENLSSVNDFRENSIKGPQYVDIDNYQLEIIGLDENSQIYSYNQIINSFQAYKKVVTLFCVEGWDVKLLWEGILLKDLLDNEDLLSEATVVIFHAYDGYTTSLPLDYLLQNDIIMAYKMNDVTIPPERGYPFQLVAESKWGYKWIKWITKIELSNDTDYQGYWESRGYSNNADLHDSFFGK